MAVLSGPPLLLQCVLARVTALVVLCSCGFMTLRAAVPRRPFWSLVVQLYETSLFSRAWRKRPCNYAWLGHEQGLILRDGGLPLPAHTVVHPLRCRTNNP